MARSCRAENLSRTILHPKKEELKSVHVTPEGKCPSGKAA